jgi:hypothetical protein
MSSLASSLAHRAAFHAPPAASLSSRRRRFMAFTAASHPKLCAAVLARAAEASDAASAQEAAEEEDADVQSDEMWDVQADEMRFDGSGGTGVDLPDKTWNSPSWNWGSARGDAHDAAQVWGCVRERLFARHIIFLLRSSYTQLRVLLVTQRG